ncbi:Hypothetical predicted protein [Mytilus galloprovincialis]|uniref:Novel STAND NTPase 3 domain-containing protein n=2 Tax=Mytilus galloprovincialis TaxID=29158 RepID=A0A8B6GMF9_MYTGA|nr:Hypothetical predicted protein [Mytilus galloprovincialis]
MGGNDLGEIKTGVLRNRLKHYLKKVLLNTTLVWSQILPRLTWRYSANIDAMDRSRQRINSSLASYIIRHGGHYIRYPDISPNSTFICQDGVHLTDIDLKQNNKNIKLTKRNEYFEETKASIKVFNQVTNHGFVIISGPPGSGKSAIANNTVLKLEESDAFIALFVSSPEEIKKSILPERKQVFVVYDVVGKYTVDYSSIQKWKKEETFIKQTFTDCSNTKLILTCRSYIYNSGFNRKLDFSPVHCDLLSCDLKLALDERRNICKMYNVPEVCDDTIMMYDFLPLLCSLTSREKENTDMFINPSKLLANEMTNSLERSDVSFIAIALLVVLDNNVEMQELSFKYPNMEELINCLCVECEYKRYFSTTTVLSAFRDMIGTYIRETEEGFTFIHNKLFHNLSFVVGSRIINCLIKYGSSEFLANRLILSSIDEKHNELLIIVQSELEESYFERLMSDIRNSYHRIVLTGIQVKHIQTKLATYLRRLKAEDLKSDDANSTPLHVVAEHGFSSLAFVLLNLKKDAIFEKDIHGNTPLHMACIGGHCEVVKTIILFDKSSMDIKNYDNLTPMEAASNNGHLSTVNVILKHVAKLKGKINLI